MNYSANYKISLSILNSITLLHDNFPHFVLTDMRKMAQSDQVARIHSDAVSPSRISSTPYDEGRTSPSQGRNKFQYAHVY